MSLRVNNLFCSAVLTEGDNVEIYAESDKTKGDYVPDLRRMRSTIMT